MTDYVKEIRDTEKRLEERVSARVKQARDTARDTVRSARTAYDTVTGRTAARALNQVTDRLSRRSR